MCPICTIASFPKSCRVIKIPLVVLLTFLLLGQNARYLKIRGGEASWLYSFRGCGPQLARSKAEEASWKGWVRQSFHVGAGDKHTPFQDTFPMFIPDSTSENMRLLGTYLHLTCDIRFSTEGSCNCEYV